MPAVRAVPAVRAAQKAAQVGSREAGAVPAAVGLAVRSAAGAASVQSRPQTVGAVQAGQVALAACLPAPPTIREVPGELVARLQPTALEVSAAQSGSSTPMIRGAEAVEAAAMAAAEQSRVAAAAQGAPVVPTRRSRGDDEAR